MFAEAAAADSEATAGPPDSAADSTSRSAAPGTNRGVNATAGRAFGVVTTTQFEPDHEPPRRAASTSIDGLAATTATTNMALNPWCIIVFILKSFFCGS